MRPGRLVAAHCTAHALVYAIGPSVHEVLIWSAGRMQAAWAFVDRGVPLRIGCCGSRALLAKVIGLREAEALIAGAALGDTLGAGISRSGDAVLTSACNDIVHDDLPREPDRKIPRHIRDVLSGAPAGSVSDRHTLALHDR